MARERLVAEEWEEKGEREEKRVSFLSWLTVGVGHSGVEKKKREKERGRREGARGDVRRAEKNREFWG